VIEYQIEKCVFCHLCEWVCSARAVEQIKPTATAIKVQRSDRFGPVSLHVCNLCEGRETQACVEACPTDALTLDGGVVKFNQQECIACLDCADACPEDAVGWDPASEKIIICDLCGGNPLCVEWCPEDVLSLSAG